MTAAAPPAPVRVGIVDDDQGVRDSLRAVLGAAGFETTAWPSAHAFLDAPEPPPDCLVVDVRMPGMSGIDLLEVLQARGLRLPVIVITGHADVRLAVRAMKLGAADFLEKPFRAPDLVAAVRDALAGAAQPGAAARELLAQLSPRETDVLRHLAAGETNKSVARALGLSPRTVETHRAHLFTKLRVRGLSQAVRLAIEADLLPD